MLLLPLSLLENTCQTWSCSNNNSIPVSQNPSRTFKIIVIQVIKVIIMIINNNQKTVDDGDKNHVANTMRTLYTHTYIYVYLDLYICIYISICMYIYIYTSISLCFHNAIGFSDPKFWGRNTHEMMSIARRPPATTMTRLRPRLRTWGNIHQERRCTWYPLVI